MFHFRLVVLLICFSLKAWWRRKNWFLIWVRQVANRGSTVNYTSKYITFWRQGQITRCYDDKWPASSCRLEICQLQRAGLIAKHALLTINLEEPSESSKLGSRLKYVKTLWTTIRTAFDIVAAVFKKAAVLLEEPSFTWSLCEDV